MIELTKYQFYHSTVYYSIVLLFCFSIILLFYYSICFTILLAKEKQEEKIL